jgi:hypothetical protein
LPGDPNAAGAGKEAGAEGGARNATRWVFRITGFEIGKAEIPPLKIQYSIGAGGEAAFVETPAFKVEIVATVTNPEEKPADIRYAFGLPRDLRPWLWLAGGIAAAVVLALLVRRWWRRRKKKPAPAAPPPKPRPLRPAYDRWLEALEALLRAGHIEAGRVKEFHVEIAEIIKRYLGEVQRFDAIDRTTWEVMEDLLAAKAPAAVRAETGAFLAECDLVKFAKHVPAGVEIESTVKRARRILDLARTAPPAGAAAGGAR